MKDSLRESTVDWIKRFTPSFLSGAKEAQQVVVRQVTASDGPMAPAGFAAGRLFVSVAGISGVLAVGLGAYGAHGDYFSRSINCSHEFDIYVGRCVELC